MVRTNFTDLKIGDELTRVLGGEVEMPVIVGYIDDNTFKVGSVKGAISWEDGWTFNKHTGLEIDEDLGWDGISKTGSYIKQ